MNRLLVIALLLFQASVFSQEIEIEEEEESEDVELIIKGEPIADFAEVEPKFPGGEAAMMSFIQESINYPDTAKALNIEGYVYVQFVVDTLGNIQDPKVLRGVHESLDNEALRIISSMPQWTPGTQRGKAVRVRYTIPVGFRLR